MSTAIILDPDGPRDPDHARDVAGALSEAVRVLNHITRDPATLPAPSDVYDVVGHLAEATRGLPQLCRQLADCIDGLAATGRLAATDPTRPTDPADPAVAARRWLESCATGAEGLAGGLGGVHNSVGRLYLTDQEG